MSGISYMDVAFGPGGSSGGTTVTLGSVTVAGSLLMGFITSPNTFTYNDSGIGGSFWTGGRFLSIADSVSGRAIVGLYRLCDGTEGSGPFTIAGVGGSNYQVFTILLDEVLQADPVRGLQLGSYSYGESPGAPGSSTVRFMPAADVRRYASLQVSIGIGLHWGTSPSASKNVRVNQQWRSSYSNVFNGSSYLSGVSDPMSATDDYISSDYRKAVRICMANIGGNTTGAPNRADTGSAFQMLLTGSPTSGQYAAMGMSFTVHPKAFSTGNPTGAFST